MPDTRCSDSVSSGYTPEFIEDCIQTVRDRLDSHYSSFKEVEATQGDPESPGGSADAGAGHLNPVSCLPLPLLCFRCTADGTILAALEREDRFSWGGAAPGGRLRQALPWS